MYLQEAFMDLIKWNYQRVRNNQMYMNSLTYAASTRERRLKRKHIMGNGEYF